MPPRLLCLGIWLFWLGGTTWLAVREVAPRWRSGEPPPYVIDLTDEVSAQAIAWLVLTKGERVGSGLIHVHRLSDRTFEYRGKFKFDNLSFFKVLKIQKVTGYLHINAEGQLLDFAAQGKFNDLIEGELQGTVEEGVIRTKVALLNPKTDWLDLKPVPVSTRGSILNPMMPLNRLPGLREGQRWTTPLFNALDAFDNVPVGLDIPLLQAEVHAAHLDWDGTKVSCLRIDYSEPGKEVTARTWVRRRDGLVLQQEASHQGLQLVLVRDMAK